MDSNLRGARLLVLNRPHDSLRVLRRQAGVIGLEVTECWPALPPDAAGHDFLVLDADTGHDGQLPWGAAPMPLPSVALIGSEAPGRIDWLLSRGVHATLMQPIGDRGPYAALLMARHRFAAEAELAARLHKQAWQLSQRENVLRAALLLVDYLYSGVQVQSFGSALIAAFVIGLFNTVLRPVLVLLTLPVTLVTLGLFLFVINALMFWSAAGVLQGFHVSGFGAALLGSLIYSVLGLVIDSALGGLRTKQRLS